LKHLKFIFNTDIYRFHLLNIFQLAYNLCFPKKVNLINLTLLNQAKNISRVQLGYTNKVWGKSVKGSWVMTGTHTNIQSNKDYYFTYKLAWEPSAAKVTESYSCRLPAIERLERETKLSLLKPTFSTLNLKNKLSAFQWVSRVP